MLLTLQQIQSIAPAAKQSNILLYLPHLNRYMPQYDITSVLRASAFLAQLLHESGSFRYLEEIASGKAYEGRKDLGNIFPGDGVRFKGRGPIQITGRNNYKQLSFDLFGDDRLLTHPENLATYELGTRAACWFWDKRKLNNYADKSDAWRSDPLQPHSFNRFQYITYRINGGQNGYADRLGFYNRALEALHETELV